MVRQIIGAKGGGGGSSFITKPDTLRSNDSFEILLGLGSGRWKGLVDGLQSFKINGVPLENEDGTSNFENVFLIFADGNPLENQIVNFKLGGGGNSQTVNTPLANDSPSAPGGWVSGAVLTPGANFIDLRFVVQQLFYQDKKGIRENTATIEIEMRPSGTSEWINIFAAPTSNSTVYDPNGYDYVEDYGGYTGRIYLSRNLFNSGGVGFKAGNGQGMAIKGKTSSSFIKEIRVSVPNTGDYLNKTWEVRARLKERDTVDNGDIQERRTIIFETITAIINEPLGDDPEWDGLVWAQIHGKASDQFNGFPEMAGVFDTKICKVPPDTVFDPETREYTLSTWDGSYVEAFTTDPAWQIKEFIEDPIHGLAGLNPGSTLDKWDALEASKYFSEQVPDGQGGYHPRFSMNYTINEAKEVDEQMQFLAGAVNSYTEDIGGGVWRFKVDKPETPIMLFTEDNIFGEFSYAHSPIDTRFNDWRGTFLDETLDYETNTVRVFDQADIDANGTKFTEVALIGCTHPQEALRRLMFRLRVSLNEYKMVTFTTNRVGRLISPLSTILVADGALNPNHLVKSTSRLHSHSSTTVTLKRPVRLQAGVSYKMKFTTTDMEVIERNVMNSTGLPGDFSVITVNAALPSNVMPESAVALEAAGLAALPVAYRVVGIERSEDNEDEYSISAVFIDVGKWDAMDNVDAEALAAQESSISIASPTIPSDGMFQVIDYTTEFQLKKVLQVNWNRPSSMFLDGFQVEYRLNDGQWRIGAGLLKDSIFELQNPEDGTYDFKITALDRRGVKSNPLLGRFEFDGDAQVTPPAHDRGDAADRPTEGLYNGYRYTATDSDPPVVFVWDAALNLWIPESNLVTEGSQIGVENGATVGMTPSEAVLFAAAQAAIDDLVATYGDTASASAAAAAAAASANDALDAASVAGGHATVASTKRDEAEGFATSAAAEAVTAGDAASVATSMAASAADSESSAATSSSLVATAKSALDVSLSDAMPKTFNPDLFGTGLTGGPTSAQPSVPNQAPSWVAPDRSYIELADVYEIGTRGLVPIKDGDVVRLTADVEQIAVGSGTKCAFMFYVRLLDEDMNLITSTSLGAGNFINLAAGERATLSKTIGYNAAALNPDYNNATAGVKYMRFLILVNRVEGGTAASSGSTARVHAFYGENFTAPAIADSKAQISTTQAAAATAAASAASQSETLTATYRDAALKAATASIPTTFEDGLTYFGGTNGQTSPFNMSPNVHATYGPNLSNTVNTNYGAASPKTRRPNTAGKKWKVRAYVGNGAGSPPTVTLALEGWDAASGGTRIEQQLASFSVTSTAPKWYEATFTSTSTGFANPVALLNYPSPYNSIQRLYALELIDVDALEAATAQAGIATTQAAIATAEAAAAKQSAKLSASIGQGYLNPDPGFDDYPNATGGPASWIATANITTSNVTRSADALGGYAPTITADSGVNTYMHQTATTSVYRPGTWLVLEGEAQLVSGALGRSGVMLRLRSGSTNTADLKLNFQTDPDVTNTVAGVGVAGRTYAFRKLVQVPPGSTASDNYQFFAFVDNSNMAGATAAKTLTFLKAAFRYATPTEIRDQTVLAPMEATVATHSSTLATHTTRLASWMQSTSAGAGVARIKMNALDVNGNAASTIGLEADYIALGTGAGPVFQTASGRATVSGDLYVQGGRIVNESATHMKVQGNGFGTANQFLEWSGPKMAINLCSEANAVTYVKTNGEAYYGGGFSTGALTNNGGSSGLSVTESALAGPFGTNGNPITVAVSWLYRTQITKTYAATTSGRSIFDADVATYGATHQGGDVYAGQTTATRPSSTLELERKIGTGSLTFVTQQGTTTETMSFNGTRPITSGDPGDATTATIIQYVSISFTYTDNAGGTGDRTFRAALNRGFSYGSGTVTQRISIVANEG